MLGHHLRRVLDRVARLLVGAGLLQNVGGQHIAHIVRAMGQKPLDCAATGPRVEDAVTLDDEPPSLIERILIIGGFGAGHLRRLDEEGPGIGSRSDQARAVPVDIGLELFVEAAEVREDQTKRLGTEERRTKNSRS